MSRKDLKEKTFVYAYITREAGCESSEKYDNLIKLLKKYGVGCIETDCVLLEKLTFKKGYFDADVYAEDILLKFEVDKEQIEEGRYSPFSFGERLFGFQENVKKIMRKLIREDEDLVSKMLDEDNQYRYTTEKYLIYKMYEALSFTDEEYYQIAELKEFDFYDFEDRLEKDGINIEDLADIEPVQLEAEEPEAEYIERVGAVLNVIENKINNRAQYPEDEKLSLINIDLLSIKDELKKAAKENKVSISIAEKSLSFKFGDDTWPVISPVKIKALKEFYHLIYDDREYTRILLARELRKFETNNFY